MKDNSQTIYQKRLQTQMLDIRQYSQKLDTALGENIMQNHQESLTLQTIPEIVNNLSEVPENSVTASRFLEVQQYISTCYFKGIAPISICNLITAYMFDQRDIPFMRIIPLRSTTNTLMLECSNILFNEFSLSEQFLISQLQVLLDKGKVPKQLVCIKSKKFKIDIDQSKNPAMQYAFSKQSTKNEMNSSIYFEMRSAVVKEKTYKILVFRKGKINIPGINTLYQLSEVQNIIHILLTFYVELTQVAQRPEIITDKLTMCNYVSKLNIGDLQRLNLENMSNLVAQSRQVQDSINQIAESFQTRCMQIEFIPERVVMYVLFQLDKQVMPFVAFNSKSTSQRKKYRSIAITVTQKGFLLIQGANDDYHKTINILRAFQSIMSGLMSQYVYEVLPVVKRSPKLLTNTSGSNKITKKQKKQSSYNVDEQTDSELTTLIDII